MICQAPTSNISDSEQKFAQTSALETRYHSFIAPSSSKLPNGHKSAKKKARRGKGRGNPKEDALANQTKQSNIQRRGRAAEKVSESAMALEVQVYEVRVAESDSDDSEMWERG
jgi:hypothetical protein